METRQACGDSTRLVKSWEGEAPAEPCAIPSATENGRAEFGMSWPFWFFVSRHGRSAGRSLALHEEQHGGFCRRMF